MIVPISKVKISRHEDGVFIAKSALLPGCHAHGRDRGEAILRFQQAAKDEGGMMNQKLRSVIPVRRGSFPGRRSAASFHNHLRGENFDQNMMIRGTPFPTLRAPIYAFTPSEQVARRLTLNWATLPIVMPFDLRPDFTIAEAERLLLAAGLVSHGDEVIILTDVVVGPDRFDSIQIRRIA